MPALNVAYLMVTDWVLIGRLAYELEERLQGARVALAGVLIDGRIGIALRRRNTVTTVAIDPFASPPLVTLEDGARTVASEPGFARSLSDALEGMVLSDVRARRGDRLIRMTFASRSRFGVTGELALYLELVPRFGNVILAKNETVVAALKEFSLAENGTRAIESGFAYALPPLPPESPSVPKLVAAAGVSLDALQAGLEDRSLLREPLYVYRRAGILSQAHIVALAGFEDAICTRQPSLLDALGELRAQDAKRGERERAARLREALQKRLAARERKLHDEIGALDAKRTRILNRDALRAEGEQLFATLHERSEPEREDAKERAAKLFAQYKKLGATLPHIEQRDAKIRSSLEAVETLSWEVARAREEDLAEIEGAIAQLDGTKVRSAAPKRLRKRMPLEVRTSSGSRILVGRSPAENADLTFRVARPNDLWFHAKDVPGAHVILARDDREAAPPEDLSLAAELAAFHSKARDSVKVPVDYTLRKHVRKQSDAPPGLVWYTNPTTIVVTPKGNL
jgi:predicted ribosome quality control (RQC) complex YloA/Tae2 family protein